MSMTEKEARERWCAFARVGTASNGSLNRIASVSVVPGTQCIASKCMAWRWGYPDHETNESTGYCGLAGSPR